MVSGRFGTRIGNASQTAFIQVWATVVPQKVAEVSDAIRRSSGRLSVSSARYSPDTQFALEGALHIDVSRMNRVIRFEPIDGIIRVQAGIRWLELLRFIQPHGFAVAVMPQFANFSIGGSVASNGHGHYVGAGPLSTSIRSLRVVLADGMAVETSRSDKPDLFRAVVGGFGGVGVVVEVELDLTENTPVMRKSLTLPAEHYVDHYRARIATDPGAVFHAAEFYAPAFKRVRATTWFRSEERCTNDQPMHLPGTDDPLYKVFDWSRPTSWFGRMREEHIVEPIRHARKVVHWRNYEASRDLLDVDPGIHEDPSLEFQEYVIEAAHVTAFLGRLREIIARHKVPAVFLSIRHYGRCEDSYLSLARRDSFSFLMAVRARPVDVLKADYAVWSRELVDAALQGGGSFNPAYQMHATAEQFSGAFGRRSELMLAKQRYDPGNRFGNGLWRRYLDDDADPDAALSNEVSEFRAAFASTASRDAAYRLLAACGPRGRAPRMMGLLEQMARRSTEDELIYRNMRSTLQKWRAATFGVLSLRASDWQGVLHHRLARFSEERLRPAEGGGGHCLHGMLEVGSDGRQFRVLRRRLRIRGPICRIDDFGCRPADTGAGWLAARLPARTTAPDSSGWEERAISNAAGSVDLVTIYGGLSGIAPSELPRCLAQLAGVLRDGGMLLLLEHDVETAHAGLDASMAVTLAFLCAGDTWEASQAHPRAFRAADEWSALMRQNGLVESGAREQIERTPFGDLLLAFRKTAPKARDAGWRLAQSGLH